jgi:hypothetical protein
MMGLYVLFIVAVWFVIVCAIAIFVARKLSGGWRRIPVGVLTAAVLFPLPLIDEIVGGAQFKRLCEVNSTIHIDRENAKGKVVYLADVPQRYIKGAWISIRELDWRFVDVKTGQTIISYSTFDAGPGSLHVSEGPLLFRGYCAPGGRVNQKELLRELGVTLVERSDVDGRKPK